MSIETDMDKVAEKMEKSTKTERDLLKDTIKQMGPEGLKKALPQLTETQKVLLKDVIVDMAKSMELDFKTVSSPIVAPKIGEGKIQEEHMDDDADEKIAQAAKGEGHRHQGGSSTEGWEGQVIKSEEVDMTTEEIIKSLSDEQKDELATKLLAKGMPADKVEKLVNKKIKASEEKDEKKDKEMIKDAVKKGEKLAEEDQTGSVDQMTEGTVRGKKGDAKDLEIKAETKADEVKVAMKKSVQFKGENDLLKAKTGGRNHHFSINGYYDQALSKSKEEPKTEEIKKSEKQDLNDLIEKSMDCTADDVKGRKMLEDNKKKINGHVKKSFSDNEIAAALGLTEEEAKKLLGE